MLYSLFHCAFSNEGCDYNPTKKSPNYVNGQYENDKTVKKWAYHINQQPFLNLCYNQLNTETYFLFKLNNDITIHITTKQGTSIMFSGAYYTHRQALHINQQPFINLSAYGNNMLFNHIRRSVNSEKMGIPYNSTTFFEFVCTWQQYVVRSYMQKCLAIPTQ